MPALVSYCQRQCCPRKLCRQFTFFKSQSKQHNDQLGDFDYDFDAFRPTSDVSSQYQPRQQGVRDVEEGTEHLIWQEPQGFVPKLIILSRKRVLNNELDWEAHDTFMQKIYSLCEGGQLESALSLIVCCGIQFAYNAYLLFLKACIKTKALALTKRIYTHLLHYHPELVPFLSNHILESLTKCGALNAAYHLLASFPHRTVFSWTLLISGYANCGYVKEALRIHQYMREDGVEPNNYTYVTLFKACTSIPSLQEVRRLHGDACKDGLVSNACVGNSLVTTYGQSGSIDEAENVFERLSCRDVVSWNALLASYVEHGEPYNAFRLYRQMQAEGVGSAQRTFVSILQACRSLVWDKEAVAGAWQEAKFMSLEIGKAVHADAWRKGLASDVYVGSMLVTLYGTCGRTMEAESVFQLMQDHSIISWNAMITAYVNQGNGENALYLYRQLNMEGLCLDEKTLLGAIQACCVLAEEGARTDLKHQSTKEMALDIGIALHAEAQKRGFTSDIFIVNILVSLYGKCGYIDKAEHVFCTFGGCDVVSWNAMLSAYTEQAKGKLALQLYQQMHKEGLRPERRTLAVAFQACASFIKEQEISVDEYLSLLEIGRALHADAWKQDMVHVPFVGNTLMSFYMKCGSMIEAENVFCMLVTRDMVSWNVLMSAYIDHNHEDKALLLYRQIIEERSKVDMKTYFIILEACMGILEKEKCTLKSSVAKGIYLEIGRALHSEVRRHDFLSNICISNALINMYGMCESIMEAMHVFEALSQPDLISWTSLLWAYSEHNLGIEALQLYIQMQEEGMSCNEQSVLLALQGCAALVEKEHVLGQRAHVISSEAIKALHYDMELKEFAGNMMVASTLVHAYGKCRCIIEAECVFDDLPYCDNFIWTVMLSVYNEANQKERALHLFTQMQKQGVPLNEIAIICVLQASSEMGNMEVCMHLHFAIVCEWLCPSSLLVNTLMRAYGGCVSMSDAQAVFNGIAEPDVVSWTAYIVGYAQEGNCMMSFSLFEEMKMAGTTPDAVTDLSILSACSHCSFTFEGVEYFESMSNTYFISPSTKHFAVVIDLLGRAGDLPRTVNFILSLPMKADLSLWLSLLGACHLHSNVDIGKWAFEHAVALKAQESAVYILMAKIYIDARLLEQAKEVEEVRQREGAVEFTIRDDLECSIRNLTAG